MYRVGLTGNIASGKSEVARVWRGLGAAVVDADELAREAVAPGSAGLAAVVDRFGDRVLAADGTLDRAGLRAIVFGDAAARAALDALLHPEIDRLRRAREADLVAAGARIVVHEIPLLFEVGLDAEMDRVVFVDAPERVRLERLVSTRGLESDEALAMMRAQGTAETKLARAGIVIDNDGSLDELRRRAAEAWREIEAAAGGSSSPRGLRIDMHVHTSRSHDCLSDPGSVVRAAVAAGLDRVCITDHNALDTALRLRDLHPELVIPGEEVRTAEGVDIIGLFLSQPIPKGTAARETCERIRAQGGVVYVPHPFAGGKGGGGRILPSVEDAIDAVETFNARLHDPALNARAAAWAAERGLPGGGGSDAHTLGEIGRAWVEVPALEDGPAGLIAALKLGRVHGRASSRAVHVASTWAKIVKRAGGRVSRDGGRG